MRARWFALGATAAVLAHCVGVLAAHRLARRPIL